MGNDLFPWLLDLAEHAPSAVAAALSHPLVATVVGMRLALGPRVQRLEHAHTSPIHHAAALGVEEQQP